MTRGGHKKIRRIQDGDALLKALPGWAKSRSDIAAILLVGSDARDELTATSDIDVMLVAENPAALLENTHWTEDFGPTSTVVREDWGAVTSLRVRYEHGMEVEFGITSLDWIKRPLDPGTKRVLDDGFKVIFDPREFLNSL